MTEIVVSMGLLLLITVVDLRMMTGYLQAEKQSYERTFRMVESLRAQLVGFGLA